MLGIATARIAAAPASASMIAQRRERIGHATTAPATISAKNASVVFSPTAAGKYHHQPSVLTRPNRYDSKYEWLISSSPPMPRKKFGAGNGVDGGKYCSTSRLRMPNCC